MRRKAEVAVKGVASLCFGSGWLAGLARAFREEAEGILKPLLSRSETSFGEIYMQTCFEEVAWFVGGGGSEGWATSLRIGLEPVEGSEC